MTFLRGSSRRTAILSVVAGFLLSFCAMSVSAGVVISQIYGAGGNSGAAYKNDYVELFNAGDQPESLAGMSLQYTSATGTGNFGANTSQIVVFDPAASIPPGGYFLVGLAGGANGADLPTGDASGTINMSGTAGKVALANTTQSLGCNGGSTPCDATALGLIVDLVGFGNANFHEGSGPAPAAGSTLAAFREADGCIDTDDNAADFVAAAPAPRNSSTAANVCPAPAVDPVFAFAAGEVTAPEGDTTPNTLVFAVDFAPAIAPGQSVSFDVDVTGDASRFVYAGPGNVVLDDTATTPYLLEVQTTPNTVTDGDAVVTVTLSGFSGTDVSQTDPISKTGTIVDDDIAFLEINRIQGSGAYSPYDGQTVTTRGIVTGVTGAGRFYIQSHPDDDDGDPATSEGLYVYGLPSPSVNLAVGDLVFVTGKVSEYTPFGGGLPITELIAPVSVLKLSSGHALPAPVELTEADLDPSGPIDALERYEYMRVVVPRFVTVAPTGPGANDEYFGVLEGTARPFREPGIDAFRCGVDPAIPGSIPLPVEAPANVPCWDNNPELLRVKSNLLVGGSVVPLRTGTVLENLTGVLDYAMGRYSILTTDNEPPIVHLDDREEGTPVSTPGNHEVTIGGFNVENLKLANGTTYERKANKIAHAIVDYLHTPDVLGLIEVADLATMQDIADRVSAIAANDPEYEAVLLAAEGNQRLGFLLKTASLPGQAMPRVSLMGTPVEHGVGMKVLCPDGVNYTPGLLNDRPPLQIDVEIQGPNGVTWPVTVINHHLKSLIGTDSLDDASASYACFNDPQNPGGGEGRRNRAKRQQNAEFVAELIADLQNDDPERAIVMVGDFNAFEFNDGYADLIGTIRGQPSPDDETVVPDDGVDLVDPDLVVLTELVDPAQRYSYTFGGNAQTLDQILANEVAVAATVDMPRMEFARVNADFHQADALDDTHPFANSDHDPALAFFDIAAFRTAHLELDAVAAPAQAMVGDTADYEFSVSNMGPDEAIDVRAVLDLPIGVEFLAVDAPAGWDCEVPLIGVNGMIDCRIDVLANGTIADFAVSVRFGAAASGQTVESDLSLSSRSTDPQSPEDVHFITDVLPAAAVIFSDGFEGDD